jgi:predicted helicase
VPGSELDEPARRGAGPPLTRAELAAGAAAAERESELSRDGVRQGGIVHTPPELARFIVRAADALLRAELGLEDGLRDARLALVDPACGPGAFFAALSALPSVSRPHEATQVHGYDRDGRALDLLRGHLGGVLGELGAQAALHHCDVLTDMPPARVAALRPTLCVLGNPPWIGGAQPRPSVWLDSLLEDFRRDREGRRLPERKLGVLTDAYVRFLRWGCEVARLAREGALLAFVTNASYLDGPVHRGLRAALSDWFDRLWIVDLGGNALLARGPQQDDNIFGVRPAAAVLLAVRRTASSRSGPAELQYSRLLGSRRAKLQHVGQSQLHELQWQRLDPQPPFRRFLPGPRVDDAYASWPSLAEAMPFHREGVQTNRDAAVIDSDRERLVARLHAFVAGSCDEHLLAACAPLPHYDPERARAAVAKVLERDPDGRAGLLVRPLVYRPFDLRWFSPIAPLCHRPRPELLTAIDRSNFALITVRKDRGEQPYRHVFAARMAVDNCLLSTRSSCRARAFPTHEPSGDENLAPIIAASYARSIGRRVSSTEFAHYALARLADPAFRLRHGQALLIDYPRIPPPSSAAAFDACARVGAALAAAMADPIELDRGPGSVARPPSPAALEALRIGHHQPLEQWTRAGRDARALKALHGRGRRIAALLSQLEGFTPPAD